jgi:hypothetical protein
VIVAVTAGVSVRGDHKPALKGTTTKTMASALQGDGPGGGKEDVYQTRVIHHNVIETIFGVLPTGTDERNKETARRRKYKQKVLAENPGKMVVDSSYTSNEGQTYTNTINVVDDVDWWQAKIQDVFCKEYSKKKKQLVAGYQLVFLDSKGNKFLCFSVYPSKRKIMVQGSDADLRVWINTFRLLSDELKNTKADTSLEGEVSVSEMPEKHLLQDEALTDNAQLESDPEEVSTKDSEAKVSDNITNAASASVMPEKHSSQDETPTDDAQLESDPEEVCTKASEPKVTDNITSAYDGAAAASASKTDVNDTIENYITSEVSDISDVSKSFTQDQGPQLIDQVHSGIDTESEDDDSVDNNDVTVISNTWPPWTLPEASSLHIISTPSYITKIDVGTEPGNVTTRKVKKQNAAKKGNEAFKSTKDKLKLRRSHRLSLRAKYFDRAEQLSASDSMQIIKLRQRLDALEGILNGLNGGVLKIVDSLNDYKENTERSVSGIGKDITRKITGIIRENASKKMCTCNHEYTQKQEANHKELMASLKTFGQSVQALTRSHHAENQSDKVQHEIRSVIKGPLDRLHQTMSDVNKEIGIIKRSVSSCETAQKKVAEKLEQQIDGKMNEGDNKQSASQNLKKQVVIDSDSDGNESDRSWTFRAPHARHAEGTRDVHGGAKKKTPNVVKKADSVKNSNRRVLLIGDSTTKRIDKRYLLKNQTVSKCRASTTAEAHEKILTGSTQDMDKIIVCVGINDLRQGSSPEQVISEMKSLVQEILYMHPTCYIYICSLLPSKSRDVTKQNITQLNAQLKDLERYSERVYYVDIISTFTSNSAPWELFDEDHLHPSKKGSFVMINCIRRKIQVHDQQKSLQRFISKPATPSTKTYAESVASPRVIPRAEHQSNEARRVCSSPKPHPTPSQDNNRPYNTVADNITLEGRHASCTKANLNGPSTSVYDTTPHPREGASYIPHASAGIYPRHHVGLPWQPAFNPTWRQMMPPLASMPIHPQMSASGLYPHVPEMYPFSRFHGY